jgi:precorrin-6Y C5,15-methyltransferase (decarboxylating)
MLAEYARLGKRSVPVYTAEKIAPVLAENPEGRFAVLVSGDTGFYSAAAKLCRELRDCQVECLPGISSVNCLAARLGRTWQDAAFVSCHGRTGHLVDTVRRNRDTFVLTGGNAKELGEALCRAGFGTLTVWLGEDLGAETESVRPLTAEKLAETETASLAVLWIENPDADGRVRLGSPDGQFIRGEVPMTKSEVRAVTLSKLAPRPADVCWDVGCGTGSVTVELALAAWSGEVYAVDKSGEAADLTEKNCAVFHLGNVTVIRGGAPEALAELPAPDVVFIGGGGRNMDAVFETILEKNPRCRITVNAIALESVQTALNAFEARGMRPDVVQVGVSAAKTVAGLHMMMAQNPIYIISGGGGNE